MIHFANRLFYMWDYNKVLCADSGGDPVHKIMFLTSYNCQKKLYNSRYLNVPLVEFENLFCRGHLNKRYHDNSCCFQLIHNNVHVKQMSL
uniref:Uncharacterized protein n=1 Tax=Anguilla anguilla TaxID=7936 RepID=A0A0E9WLQ8_ANGAN